MTVSSFGRALYKGWRDLRLAILSGPASPEDQAYYRAAQPGATSTDDIVAALVRGGWNRPLVVDVTLTPVWLASVRGVDLVIVNLHGAPGEDGTVQAVLDAAGVPYLGSGVEASVLALNKHVTKLIAASVGVPTPAWQLVTSDRPVPDWPADRPALLKPVRGGSSLGIRALSGETEAVPQNGSWFVEERVDGVDATVTVVEVDGRPHPLDAVVLEHRRPWLDEQVKLAPEVVGRAVPSRPAHLLPSLERCRAYAAQMHTAHGCRDLSRVDFVVTESDVWFLELNTLPGISPASYAASSAASSGFDYTQFLATLLDSARRRGRGGRSSP